MMMVLNEANLPIDLSRSATSARDQQINRPTVPGTLISKLKGK